MYLLETLKQMIRIRSVVLCEQEIATLAPVAQVYIETVQRFFEG